MHAPPDAVASYGARTVALEEDMAVLRASMFEAIRLLEQGLPAADVLRRALASTARTATRHIPPPCRCDEYYCGCQDCILHALQGVLHLGAAT